MTTSDSLIPKQFLLLYASQTGQAKAIAEEIRDTSPLHGLKANLFCLSLIDKRFCIEKESCVVFVVSTTGDGEPPDSAVKFLRRLNRQTLKSNYLENLNYTLLALGDSNYIKFCLFGRQLEKRLKFLSAKSFYPTGYGDDAFGLPSWKTISPNENLTLIIKHFKLYIQDSKFVGIETAVDPWLENLWPYLQKQLGVNSVPTNDCTIDAKLHGTVSLIIENISNKIMENSIHDKEILSISELSSVLQNIDIKKCRIPKLPAPTLLISFEKRDAEEKKSFSPDSNNLHSQASPLAKATLVAAKRLTYSERVKITLELKFQFEEVSVPYEPGDSFGFICSNSVTEVEALLKRLNVIESANLPVILQLSEHASSNKRKLPSHIPEFLTLKDIFLHCIEIRSVPKKILLRILAEYSTDEKEKETLLFLSSPEGAKYYTDFVRKPYLSILDILLHFPSCSPPVEKLLEYLPNLKPRFYSVASSPLEDPNSFKILFHVLNFTKDDGRMYEREGVCTGWLNELSSQFQKADQSNLEDISGQMSKLNLESLKATIFIYKRQNNNFHFPDDLNCPIIMVGPGVGIAPFIGYLQHRERRLKNSSEIKSEVWLFYGCRYETLDFLYRVELDRLEKCGILTHMMVSFSRETPLPPTIESRYVHENIRLHADDVATSVMKGGKIFVCGDAQHMARDVEQAFIEAFKINSGFTDEEAKSFVSQLQTEHRYNNDVWA